MIRINNGTHDWYDYIPIIFIQSKTPEITIII
jgi:hypothetical protein